MLQNGDMFLLRVDHAAIYELHNHTACEDPLDHMFASLKSFGTQELWDYAWALTYKHRSKNYPVLTFVQFLELLPVRDQWIELRSLIMSLLIQSLPSVKKKSDAEQVTQE